MANTPSLTRLASKHRLATFISDFSLRSCRTCSASLCHCSVSTCWLVCCSLVRLDILVLAVSPYCSLLVFRFRAGFFSSIRSTLQEGGT